MALPHNRKAVVSILGELKPRIIGKELPGFSCSCGAIKHDPATAVEVEPAGNSYPGQEELWFLWQVRMSHHPENPSILDGYSVGLSRFVPLEELEKLFSAHFGENPRGENPYTLEVDGAERVHQGLPAAVRISEDGLQFRFAFDWGREQEVARELESVCQSSPPRIPAGTEAFARIIQLLRELRPEVYRGGPDPELPTENSWHLNYQEALNAAEAQANHVFFQNTTTTIDWRGGIFARADVVFMKVEVL
jgi:hypothetical protein